MELVSELKGDLCIVSNALAKIKEDADAGQISPDSDSDKPSVGQKADSVVNLEEIQNAVQDLTLNLNS